MKRDTPAGRKAATLAEKCRALVGRIADASDSLISVVSLARDRYTYVNDGLAKFLGVSKEKLVSDEGLRWARSRIHPEDIARVAQAHEDLRRRLRAKRQNRGFFDQECRILNAAGEWRWVHSRVSLDLHAPDGTEEVIVVGNDDTDRHVAQEKLRTSEERFRQLIDNIKDVFWVFSPDLTTPEYLSPAFEEVWGRPIEAALRDPTVWAAAIHPDDHPVVRAAIQRALHSHALDVTFRILGPDGQLRWMENHGVAVYRESELDESGFIRRPVRAFVGVARDITEDRAVHEELTSTKASLAEAQRIAQSGSWDWEIDTDALRWSDEVYRIFGFVPREFAATYSAFLERIHPEDRPAVEAAVAHSLTTGKPYSVEHRIVRPDGEIRRVEERGDLIFADRRAVRMVGVIRDITDQRTADRIQRTLASAVEQTDDHVLVTDRGGSIEFVNPAFEKTSGYSLDEIRGKTPAVLKSGRHKRVFYDRLWQTITAGEAFRANFENRRKDGSIYVEEKTITPIRGVGEEITHFVSVGRDITVRRAAEEEQAQLAETVRRSAVEWTATFDAVEMPIAVVNSLGLVTRMNMSMAAAAGTRVQQMIGRPLPQHGGEPWSSIQAMTGEVSLTRRSAHQELRDETSGNTWQVTVSPIAQKTRNHAPSLVVVARDVSGMVRLREKLQRTETMSAMGELLAGVAHEVRNPLFGISATLDAFEEDFRHIGESATYLRLIRGEVERLTVLMRDLLEFGKRSAAVLEPGAIEPVVRRAVRACLPIAMPRISIDLHFADDLPAVSMDPSRLAQVLQNLIENAVQHSPDGGRVNVVCERLDQTLRCSIQDDGPGLSDTDARRVFEPFYSRRRGGTGLGLSIVQRIVEEHGGRVYLANRADGGMVATVDLPLTGSQRDGPLSI